MNVQLKNPIMVALDLDSRERCLEIANALEGKVGAFKIGPRLIVRHGSSIISEIARKAPVFVDNKYLDIPNTMDTAIRATFEAGATFATVHCWAGKEALTRLAETERELNRIRPFQILAVTVLTSFTQEGLPPTMINAPIVDQVSALAKLALDSGLSGIVCSPEEVGTLRAQNPRVFLVTPGIRMPVDAKGDQKRVLGPKQAIEAGASALVIGRPIVDAKDPIEATQRILADLARS